LIKIGLSKMNKSENDCKRMLDLVGNYLRVQQLNIAIELKPNS